MAILQFVLTSPVSYTFSVGQEKGGEMAASIQLLEIKIQLSNGGFLDSGVVSILSQDDEIGLRLSSEGAVGIIHCHRNEEGNSYTVQLHVSDEEQHRLTKIISRGNALKLISLETPLHSNILTHTLVPDQRVPFVWNESEGMSVLVEKASFGISFNTAL